jgi:hypothetical protein
MIFYCYSLIAGSDCALKVNQTAQSRAFGDATHSLIVATGNQNMSGLGLGASTFSLG